MSLYADVVLPLPLDQAYTYAVLGEMEGRIREGMRVLVPFGERVLTGFVVRTRKRKKQGDLELKAILEALDEAPIFTPSFLSLTEKLSRSSFAPWGEVLQAAVPPSFLLRTKVSVELTPQGRQALANGLMSEKEMAVAALLKEKAHSPRFLERTSRVKNLSSLLPRLEKKGLILISREMRRARRRPKGSVMDRPTQLELDFTLDENLRRVGDVMAQALIKKAFLPFLLYGSAERREAVYFHLIRKALLSSGRVLYLVPEISLSPALLDKLHKRLGEKAALLHSRLPERKREAEWEKIREKRADVVVGPRSALLSPLDNVRLIILDEEQDSSYFQPESPLSDVRAGAWLRAREEKTVLILGSAAPTVEAFYKAIKGRYLMDIGAAAPKAKITLVNSLKDPGIVSLALKKRIGEELGRKSQVLIFYNRRGYAASLVCARCGFIPKCRRCDLALSYHKREEKLVCHYCRSAVPRLEACPRCGSRLIGRRGPGIEAVAEDIKRTLPHNRVEIFATDEASRKAEKADLLQDFKRGKIDILIGTQLLTHQTDLPAVSLLAILHPEMILNLADFRSGQKAFQAIARSFKFLRDDKTAEAWIQTSTPEHFSICEAARGNYRGFYEQEIKLRRLMDYPPFSCLAEVVFQGENLRRLAQKAREFAARVRNSGENIKIFGPSLAPVAKVKGLSRVVVSLKTRRKDALVRVFPAALKGMNVKKSVFLFD